MLIAFLIMLREGIEAALIVGIVAGYLRQTGRTGWLPAVWGGAGLAAVLCLTVGVALNAASAEFPQRQQEFFEGVVALVAVGMLTSMVFWMARAARSMRAQLHGSVDTALRPDAGRWRGLALVGMVFLAVGREGLESVFFLLATFQQSTGPAVPAGALLGLGGAVAVGWAIYIGGVRIDLRRFFQATSVFILFVAAGLLSGAVRAFHEAGLWNGLQHRVYDLSAVLPDDSPLGVVLSGFFGYHEAPSAGEVIAYLAFLLPALALLRLRVRPPPAMATAGG
ncbi:MAG: iron transporter [Rhodospirillales bacterium 70-18]|nr:MAG: iron transporter [Rhodospirillales bacterium 70-18]